MVKVWIAMRMPAMYIHSLNWLPYSYPDQPILAGETQWEWRCKTMLGVQTC